jgi:hypothetical protein
LKVDVLGWEMCDEILGGCLSQFAEIKKHKGEN